MRLVVLGKPNVLKHVPPSMGREVQMNFSTVLALLLVQPSATKEPHGKSPSSWKQVYFGVGALPLVDYGTLPGRSSLKSKNCAALDMFWENPGTRSPSIHQSIAIIHHLLIPHQPAAARESGVYLSPFTEFRPTFSPFILKTSS